MEDLIKQIEIIKEAGIKPNYSELSRMYGVDRRTVKKYFEGYEGRPTKRNKPSKLDKYYYEIKAMLLREGITIRAVYEKLKEEGLDVGTYSNFSKYVKRKGLYLWMVKRRRKNIKNFVQNFCTVRISW